MFIKIDNQYLSECAFSLAITAGAIAALTCRWEAVKVLGLTILAGIGFEFLTHYQSARVCIEYFTVDHSYHGKDLEKRLVKTLNPFYNAAILSLNWSYSYTIPASALSFFAQVTLPKLTTSISAKQLAPYLITTALLSVIFGDLSYRYVKRKIEKQIFKEPIDLSQADIPKEIRSLWEASNKRFEMGRAVLRASWLIVAVVVVAHRAGLIDRDIFGAILKENIEKIHLRFFQKIK